MSEQSFNSRSKPLILQRKRKADTSLEHSKFPENVTVIDTPVINNGGIANEKNGYASARTYSQVDMEVVVQQMSPLPELSWANHKELWEAMVEKENSCPRTPDVLLNHPEIEPRMRAILLDWLIEVCEVYRLHRETFHLALDYVDRYLITTSNLPRQTLQLVGATALFVACKMEEIYPPKLEQFAYVTDGACTEKEILAQEMILTMKLEWNLSPVTINNWLNIFMQLAFSNEIAENLLGPEKYSTRIFVRIAQALDLCILDIESLKFSYRHLTAAAVAHYLSKEVALLVTGLNLNDLMPCYNWMERFVRTVRGCGGAELKYFSDVTSDDLHNIQLHNVDLNLLAEVKSPIREQRS